VGFFFSWLKIHELDFYFGIASRGFQHPPPIGCTELEADKENEPTTSSPFQKKTSSLSGRHTNSNSPRPLQDIRLTEVAAANVGSPSSPAFFFATGPPATSRALLSFQPLIDPLQIKQDPDTTPINVSSRSVKRAHMPSSSDTEEDSQGIFWLVSESIND
jgi:hypothetical protein